MRYGVLVLGPAGAGKSRLCSSLQRHKESKVHVVNLDPAADQFDYTASLDVRELISVTDVMEDEELNLGPNASLVFAMEFLVDHFDSWLKDNLDELIDDEGLILFDCPGQIELFTHLDVMTKLSQLLISQCDFRLAALFLLDAHFLTDASKWISGSLVALSAMTSLELPHLNVVSKIDLLSKRDRRHLDRFLHPDSRDLIQIDDDDDEDQDPNDQDPMSTKYSRLTSALGRVMDDYSLVNYIPLDLSDEESIDELLLVIDNLLQMGEDAETKALDLDAEEPDEQQ